MADANGPIEGAPAAVKTCRRCGQSKPFAEYSKHRTGAFGLQPRCRECRREDAADYYARNRRAVLARNAEWASANPDARRRLALAKYLRDRAAAIAALGGSCPCGEVVGLEIDHIAGGGSAHRRAMSNGQYYARIAKGEMLDTFQVLCSECHASKTSAEISRHNQEMWESWRNVVGTGRLRPRLQSAVQAP